MSANPWDDTAETRPAAQSAANRSGTDAAAANTFGVAPKAGATGGGGKNQSYEASMKVILVAMHILNFANAALLGVSCYFSFQLIGGEYAVTQTFLSVYIGFFALLLLMFELRVLWKRIEEMVKKYFGFLFSFVGRGMFFIFLGAINFGMISKENRNDPRLPWVIVAGVATGANAFINCFIICYHPAFRNAQRELTEAEVRAYLEAHPELAAEHGVKPRSDTGDSSGVAEWGGGRTTGGGGGGSFSTGASVPDAYIPPVRTSGGATSAQAGSTSLSGFASGANDDDPFGADGGTAPTADFGASATSPKRDPEAPAATGTIAAQDEQDDDNPFASDNPFE